MAAQWLLLKLGQPWEVAVPFPLVAKILHRHDPDYPLWAPQAISLGSVLGVKPAPHLPGVLVVFFEGACWHVGDLSLSQGDPWEHLSLPSWVFPEGKTWCRGILAAGDQWAFIADPEGVRALA